MWENGVSLLVSNESICRQWWIGEIGDLGKMEAAIL